MLRLLQIFSALTLFPLFLSSQAFDEKKFLKSLPKLKNDSNKVNKLIAYCNQLSKNGNTQKALSYADSAARLAKKIKFSKGELEALSFRRSIHYGLYDFESTLIADHKKLEIYQSINDQSGVATTEEAIGTDFVRLNKADSALLYFKRSLQDHKSTGNKAGIAQVSSILGNIYLVKQDYGKALNYSKESLKIYEELKDMSGLQEAYTSLVHVYNEIGNTPAAENYSRKLSQMNKELTKQ